MHAVVLVTKMNPEKREQQRKELEEQIVPMVKGLPGFVSGTWMHDYDDDRASSIVVFDNDEAARQMATMLRNPPPSWEEAGVAFDTLLVGEVLAHART